MGASVRGQRLPGALKVYLAEAGRRPTGGAAVRGMSLVVLFLFGSMLSSGQSNGELTSEAALRLKQQIGEGTAEQKRSALAEIRNLRSIEASLIALPALRDVDELVRATAASSVVFLPKADAARALIPLLDDRAEFVRREAAYALGEAGDTSAVAPLVRMMQNQASVELRSAAAIALGMIGDPVAVERLIAILKTRPREEDEFLRRSAARAVGQIAQIAATGNRSVITPQNFLPDKFKDLEPGTRPGYDFSRAVDALAIVVRDKAESDDTRREAAYSLGSIGDPRSTPVLRSLVTSADPYMAEIAREALLKIERRNKTAVPGI